MKKTFQIKRTLRQTPKGLKAYYFQDGKRIKDSVGRRKFIKKNYESLDKPYQKTPKNLTADEIRAFNRARGQKELYRYQGKPVDKFMVELLKAKGAIRYDDKERDIMKLTDQTGRPLFQNYGQFEQAFISQKDTFFETTFETMMGASGYRGRLEIESIFSIAEGLGMVKNGFWDLETIVNGNPIYGYNKGLDAIRKFEEEETAKRTKADSNVAAVRFTYALAFDPSRQVVTIVLAIPPVRVEEMRSI